MDTNNSSNNSCASCAMSCKCCCNIVAPVAVILIGVSALLNVFGAYDAYVHDIVWPVLLMVAAASKLCNCCR